MTSGPAFDLDASAFLVKPDGRVRNSQDIIYYNNKVSADGSVWHHGDNLTGYVIRSKSKGPSFNAFQSWSW